MPVQLLEAGEKGVGNLVQPGRLPLRQDQRAGGQGGEVGSGVAAAGDDEGREGQRQGGAARIGEGSAEETRDRCGHIPTAKHRCPCQIAGVALRQVRSRVVLQPGQDRRRCEGETNHERHRPVEDQAHQPPPHRERALGRGDHGSVEDVPAEREQGVVGALAKPGGQNLTKRETSRAPPGDPSKPAPTLDCQLHREQEGRQPCHHLTVGGAADVASVEQPRELVGHCRRQRSERPHPEGSAQSQGRQARQQQVKEDPRLGGGDKGQGGEEEHRRQVHPAGLGVGREGDPGELVRIPAWNIARGQPLPEGAEDWIKEGGAVLPNHRPTQDEVPGRDRGEGEEGKDRCNVGSGTAGQDAPAAGASEALSSDWGGQRYHPGMIPLRPGSRRSTFELRRAFHGPPGHPGIEGGRTGAQREARWPPGERRTSGG